MYVLELPQHQKLMAATVDLYTTLIKQHIINAVIF